MHRKPFCSTTLKLGRDRILGSQVVEEIVCASVKSCTLGTICLLEPKCYLSPFTGQSQYKFSLGEPSPNLAEGSRLGSRVWYPVKLLHISYNLCAGKEILSLSVYEPIAIQILHGGSGAPIWEEGVELGVECGTP